MQIYISVVELKKEIIDLKNNAGYDAMQIESVSLKIKAIGHQLEIPLDAWQVDILSRMLGLCVDTKSLANYKMASKETVDAHMEMYYKAIREMACKSEF